MGLQESWGTPTVHDREYIRRCLEKAGYDAELKAGASTLTLAFNVGERRITLIHAFPDDLLRTPKFHFAGGYDGKLAHVGVERNGEPGEVCIGDPGSTSVNTGRPERVYLETAQKLVAMLTRLIDDPEYNRAEQLREFEAHWEILCRNGTGGLTELFVSWDGHEVQRLQVKPPRATSGSALRKTYIAMANVQQPLSVCGIADWESRQTLGKALGVPLTGVEPAPATREELLPWFLDAVTRADPSGLRECRRLRKKRRCDYWLVFSAPIPDAEAMFAIHWHSCSAGPLPSSEAEAVDGQWTATPYRVRSLSRKSLVPRGGGSLDMSRKSILLVGCGSVGSELAMRLTSAGVGRLTVSDYDTFSEHNLYRHVLSVNDIGRFKTEALAREIILRHPWAKVTSWHKRLEELRDPARLQPFDLVVIAIGSPTVERVFAEYCRQVALGVPVINCWLEGYGIGGHAILSIPGEKGCWHCAYVDPKMLTRGLTSNLNFLKPGQVVMRNQGGCGTHFLPYSGIAASCTATMAADLAVRFFAGEVTGSSKVSWRGSDAEARRESLDVTWRYRHFAESLRILPLHDRNCDLCGG